MALSTKTYKGARDFYPEDKRLQKYMFSKWSEVCESFGYVEYDAPIIEPLEIYQAKTGEEIVNEQTYLFEDRGGRKVVIRPEMTPSVSRMVAARRQELVYPLRWYSIPNLWRYERPQRGRLREHYQLNADIFGLSSIEAEVEMVILIDSIFKAFAAKEEMYEIRVSSRKFMDHILTNVFKLSEKQSHNLRKLIDRIHKLERSVFLKQLDEILSPDQKKNGVAEKLMSLLSVTAVSYIPDFANDSESLNELKQMFKKLNHAGIKNVKFDPTIMRGFDYYTDIVFEVFDNNPANNRSMLGGGRYDGLVGLFGVEPVPTVGFGWGDVTLLNFLEDHNLVPVLDNDTDLELLLVGKVTNKVYDVAAKLRTSGLNVSVDFSGRKLSDQLRATSKKGVSYVLIVGEEEIKTGVFKLKDMSSSEELSLTLDKVAERLLQKEKR